MGARCFLLLCHVPNSSTHRRSWSSRCINHTSLESNWISKGVGGVGGSASLQGLHVLEPNCSTRDGRDLLYSREENQDSKEQPKSTKKGSFSHLGAVATPENGSNWWATVSTVRRSGGDLRRCSYTRRCPYEDGGPGEPGVSRQGLENSQSPFRQVRPLGSHLG